jgi:hypothetical protein
MIPPAAKLSRGPPCDIGGGRLMPSFTDPDGNVFRLFRRGSGDQSRIGLFSARRGAEHTGDVEARSD